MALDDIRYRECELREMFCIRLAPIYKDLVVKLDDTRRDYLCIIDDLVEETNDEEEEGEGDRYLRFTIPAYLAYAPIKILDELLRFSINMFAGLNLDCPLRVMSYLKSFDGSKEYLKELCETEWVFLRGSHHLDGWMDDTLLNLYDGHGPCSANVDWALDLVKEVADLKPRLLRVSMHPERFDGRRAPYLAADCMINTILVSRDLEVIARDLAKVHGNKFDERALNYVFMYAVAYISTFDIATCRSDLEAMRRITEEGLRRLAFSEEEMAVINKHFNAYSIRLVNAERGESFRTKMPCNESPWIRVGYAFLPLAWERREAGERGPYVALLREMSEKDWGQNCNLAIELFARYDGKVYRGIDPREVTGDVLNDYADIVDEIGGDYIDLGDGYDVRPDYFPTLDPDEEVFDTGFTLYFRDREVGRVRNIWRTKDVIVIDTARTRISLERDMSQMPPPLENELGLTRATFPSKSRKYEFAFRDLLSEKQRIQLDNMMGEQVETAKPFHEVYFDEF